MTTSAPVRSERQYSALRGLKAHLDGLLSDLDARYLHTDPLLFLHRYERPEDREVVGLIASSLAYGRVDQIRNSVERVLSVMGPAPCDFVKRFNPVRDGVRFADFAHRFNDGRDVACLIYFMKQVLDREGSVGAFFTSFFRESDENVGPSLTRFVDEMLSLDFTPFYEGDALPKGAGVRFFFPSPRDGSACKRLNLYLRWMVRGEDGLDFGQWERVPPSRLVIPLDTHVARIARYIGLTKMRSPGWRMAVDVTRTLKKLDPDDPVKYDFAICRLGILDRCPARRDPGKCAGCRIRGICLL